MQHLALGIQYRGSAYHGWQTQKHMPNKTVQELLESALSYIANSPIKTVCAGRTDTGVHGMGQVVSISSPTARPDKAWISGGNTRLPKDIRVQWVRPVQEGFSARFDAESRTYRYVIYCSDIEPALLQGLVTWSSTELDVDSMHRQAQGLVGEHDFSSFRGSGCQSRTPFRNITRVSVTQKGKFVTVEITANAFLLHMVRNIVGALLEVGTGRKKVTYIDDVLAAKDRSAASKTAPPGGLCLTSVAYPKEFELNVNTDTGFWF